MVHFLITQVNFVPELPQTAIELIKIKFQSEPQKKISDVIGRKLTAHFCVFWVNIQPPQFLYCGGGEDPHVNSVYWEGCKPASILASMFFYINTSLYPDSKSLYHLHCSGGADCKILT